MRLHTSCLDNEWSDYISAFMLPAGNLLAEARYTSCSGHSQQGTACAFRQPEVDLLGYTGRLCSIQSSCICSKSHRCVGTIAGSSDRRKGNWAPDARSASCHVLAAGDTGLSCRASLQQHGQPLLQWCSLMRLMRWRQREGAQALTALLER